MTQRTLNGFQPSAFQNDAFQMADRVAGSGGARIPFWHSMLRTAIAEAKRRKREQEQGQEVEHIVALDHPQTIPLRFAAVYAPPRTVAVEKLRAARDPAADLAAFTKFMEALAELDEDEFV